MIRQLVIGNKAAAVDDVTHLVVEHGDGGGEIFHEQTQDALVPFQRIFRLLAFGDICDDGTSTFDLLPAFRSGNLFARKVCWTLSNTADLELHRPPQFDDLPVMLHDNAGFLL